MVKISQNVWRIYVSFTASAIKEALAQAGIMPEMCCEGGEVG
tara:strand:+ start:37255 stop:37380 length:126 start_codon:yes stop_codon:yes gene_type:complete